MFTLGEQVSWVNDDGSRHEGAILSRVTGLHLEATGEWEILVAKEFRSSYIYTPFEKRYGVIVRHQAKHFMRLAEAEPA